MRLSVSLLGHLFQLCLAFVGKLGLAISPLRQLLGLRLEVGNQFRLSVSLLGHLFQLCLAFVGQFGLAISSLRQLLGLRLEVGN